MTAIRTTTPTAPRTHQYHLLEDSSSVLFVVFSTCCSHSRSVIPEPSQLRRRDAPTGPSSTVSSIDSTIALLSVSSAASASVSTKSLTSRRVSSTTSVPSSDPRSQVLVLTPVLSSTTVSEYLTSISSVERILLTSLASVRSLRPD